MRVHEAGIAGEDGVLRHLLDGTDGEAVGLDLSHESRADSVGLGGREHRVDLDHTVAVVPVAQRGGIGRRNGESAVRHASIVCTGPRSGYRRTRRPHG
ncbi:hypothetical protein [Kitasatospora acidiphila]|uniref:hypothetical protein n=1 Tax=Kitasatospora acidiphila TaxID=2567942 RepID=UPI001E630E5F|nr:hypothetical protein [Kitasatospora acidiphila]